MIWWTLHHISNLQADWIWISYVSKEKINTANISQRYSLHNTMCMYSKVLSLLLLLRDQRHRHLFSVLIPIPGILILPCFVSNFIENSDKALIILLLHHFWLLPAHFAGFPFHFLGWGNHKGNVITDGEMLCPASL